MGGLGNPLETMLEGSRGNIWKKRVNKKRKHNNSICPHAGIFIPWTEGNSSKTRKLNKADIGIVYVIFFSKLTLEAAGQYQWCFSGFIVISCDNSEHKSAVSIHNFAYNFSLYDFYLFNVMFFFEFGMLPKGCCTWHNKICLHIIWSRLLISIRISVVTLSGECPAYGS